MKIRIARRQGNIAHIGDVRNGRKILIGNLKAR
jgi:hypothetical protein